jgi:glycosyltransferase involved in cell wall biosynthesis
MKILIASHSSNLVHPGGAETAAFAQANYMRSKGHEVVHIACHPGLDEDFGYEKNTNTHLIKSSTETGSFLWDSDRTAILWAERLSEIKPDVVHLHHYLNCGILLPALIKKILPTAKVILTFHEYLAICGRSGQMIDKNGNLCESSGIRKCSSCLDASPKAVAINVSLIELGLQYVDEFISPSQFLLERYVSWGIPRGKIHKIENFLNIKLPNTPNPTDSANSTSIVINFVSQHTPTKGLEVLLQAILDLKVLSPSTLRKVRFNIWGSGSERWPDFHSRVEELKELTRNHAFFMGKYQPQDLARIYAGSSYTIVPSTWWENAPCVIQ